VEFQLEGESGLIKAEVIRNKGSGEMVFRINDKDYELKLLKSSTSDFEFILGNTFHDVKILHSDGPKYKVYVDGVNIEIKKHSKLLTEIIEKSLKSKGSISQANIVKSQIPGRVVKISGTQGEPIKEGDPIVILESMKMQVAIKAHKDGLLKEIKVSEGSTVSRYEVVAIIE
jgi:biotin carboxyl carrier protein